MTMTLSGTNGGIGVIGSGTAVASTSGTSIDFTGLPAGLKRITVMFNGVSTNGTSNLQVQIGSGSVTTSGYASSITRFSSTALLQNTITSGFGLINAINTSADLQIGHLILTNVSGNIWISSSSVYSAGYVANQIQAGSITLSGTLDRVRITTVGGTDTFDAGSVNILYE